MLSLNTFTSWRVSKLRSIGHSLIMRFSEQFLICWGEGSTVRDKKTAKLKTADHDFFNSLVGGGGLRRIIRRMIIYRWVKTLSYLVERHRYVYECVLLHRLFYILFLIEKSVNLALRFLFRTILHWIHGYVRKHSTQKIVWIVFYITINLTNTTQHGYSTFKLHWV